MKNTWIFASISHKPLRYGAEREDRVPELSYKMLYLNKVAWQQFVLSHAVVWACNLTSTVLKSSALLCTKENLLIIPQQYIRNRRYNITGCYVTMAGTSNTKKA